MPSISHTVSREKMHAIQKLLDEKKFEEALGDLRKLASDANKYDNKVLQVETNLLTARAWHAMGNPQKAMSSVVAARTGSAGMFLPSPIAAELEHLAALTNAADNDFNTAYSYWFEALQAYTPLTDAASISVLTGKAYTPASPTTASAPAPLPTARSGGKSVFVMSKEGFAQRALVTCVYLVLSKLMSDNTADLPKLIASADVAPYAAAPAMRSMMAIVGAYRERDLHTLHSIVASHRAFAKLPPTSASMSAGAGSAAAVDVSLLPPSAREDPPPNAAAEAALHETAAILAADGVLAHHIGSLEEKMLDRHVERLVAPYARVQLSYLAQRVGVPVAVLERKVSLMILDGGLDGVIQQTPHGAHVVRAIPPPAEPPQYAMICPQTVDVTSTTFGASIPLGVRAEVKSARLVERATLDRDAEDDELDGAAAVEGAFYKTALPALDALSEVVDALAERHAREMARFPLGIRSSVHSASRRSGVDAIAD